MNADNPKLEYTVLRSHSDQYIEVHIAAKPGMIRAKSSK